MKTQPKIEEKIDIKTFDELDFKLIMEDDELKKLYKKNLKLQLQIEGRAKEESLKTLKNIEKKEDDGQEDEDEEALKHFPKEEEM
jgi:hypothetical protein